MFLKRGVYVRLCTLILALPTDELVFVGRAPFLLLLYHTNLAPRAKLRNNMRLLGFCLWPSVE